VSVTEISVGSVDLGKGIAFADEHSFPAVEIPLRSGLHSKCHAQRTRRDDEATRGGPGREPRHAL
jgi:hypothetical protein